MPRPIEPTDRQLLRRLRVRGRLDVAAHDPRETFGWVEAEAKEHLVNEVAAIGELQQRLFAERRHSLLLVLQAMDAGGKGGVIREVLVGINPAGIKVTTFGAPTEADLAHDYLWRVHPHTPADGQIAVWDRSHYEDVLVVRVKELAPERVWKRRYGHIVAFERLLADEGTTIVKLFLNVSKRKQRDRLQDRIDSPDERWKFRLADLEDRQRWPQFQQAYHDAMVKTSTAHAPWYVVPGDRKWVRNLVVARIVRHTLEEIDPQYPEPEEGIEGLVVQ